MSYRESENGYILNINSGILHTKDCADGVTGQAPVAAGSRKHYSDYDHAIEDENYDHDHDNDECLYND